MGNMGGRYAAMIEKGLIRGMTLGAITRVSAEKRPLWEEALKKGLPLYESADDLFKAVEDNKLDLDAVIIATPHYSHEALCVRAFENGLHVLCEKPSGVYSRQARIIEEAAQKSGKVFGMIFNQRTLPVHQRLYDLVHSQKYGALKRVNWVVTDWYRPESYFSSSSWHATWDKDGGGVLLNQCPHNLDLLHWIAGMPSKVQAFCHEGRFHHIEVEDDVTAYMEWENGANGCFITSTGDAPGINRLEISLEEAMVVCEKGRLRIGEVGSEMGMKEADYRASATDFFKKIKGTWTEETFEEAGDAYEKVLNAFSSAIRGEGENIAPGTEGRKSLLLINAMYLSSWEREMISLPKAKSLEERAFEERFEAALQKKLNPKP